MPPANSPDSEQPPSFISALRELESPVNEDVLNLAATLGTQAEDDDEGDEPHPSLHYLRASQEHDQLRLERSRERLRLLERQRDELDQRDRLRRVMSRLSRLSDSNAAYGDRVPSQNNLYDWSPANEADDEDELDQILAELRREQPNTHPEILRVLGRSQLDSERERIRSISTRLQNNQSSASGTAESSLRSTAILQSVRRHPRFSARTREYLQRNQSDRESSSRSAQRSESRERHSSESAARQIAMQRLSEGRTSLDRERRDMLSRADSYRRSFLDRASSSAPTVSPLLEQTVKYLSRIRHSATIDDSLNYALDAGFLSKDYFCIQYADFVTDTFTIPPPAETSWLAPGAVLSGCQHATSVTTTVTTSAPGAGTTIHRFRIVDGSGSTTLPALPPPSRPWVSNSYSSTRSQTSPRLPEPLSAQPSQQDRWPVKVTIHSVDWEKMSLSATMEAYNVPSHPHSHQSIHSTSASGNSPSSHQPTRTSSITTYLEGEILDFNTHTLLTESFKSNAANDATYWRKLPPFQKMSDEEVVRALTSKKWLTEVLGKEWILMRWKERCFVKSLNRTTADPVQPPPSATTSFTDGPAHEPFPSSTTENAYLPSTHASPLQTTPYRIVRNQQTGRAELEISSQFNFSSATDGEQATFDDSGCGLTISGFYYVCLRRSDGKLEGLYYDPQSSPYQCLKLESVRGGVFPAWGFR
ncbi:vacuolar import and degradation protein-domain-containing protein [Pyrenochaeta sp. MPI-SDFR-AT-0127]|nr:vacuolar import and degradation protein-domain-containing protein [Pyrenochaeta sp. MPI-SDFR-AT-0127]